MRKPPSGVRSNPFSSSNWLMSTTLDVRGPSMWSDAASSVPPAATRALPAARWATASVSDRATTIDRSGAKGIPPQYSANDWRTTGFRSRIPFPDGPDRHGVSRGGAPPGSASKDSPGTRREEGGVPGHAPSSAAPASVV